MAIVLPPGNVLSLSLGGPHHEDHSLAILEDSGVASQIVLELCTSVHGPAARLHSKQTRHIFHRLARKSQDIHWKCFEVKFPSAIGVSAAACFWELRHIFCALSDLIPLDVADPTFEHQDIHFGEIFSAFGLMYATCYMYRPCSKFWLVLMRCILRLIFDIAIPF